MDQAFAARTFDGATGGFTGERFEGAVVLTHHGKDGMGDQTRLVALLGQLGEGGIEQERLVVVDDLEDRDLAFAPTICDSLVPETQIGLTGLAPAG